MLALLVWGCGDTRQPHQQPDDLLSGMYSHFADAADFYDCRTRTRYPVVFEADHRTLERAYLEHRRDAGEPLLVEFVGRIVPRPRMEGDGTVPTVVVDRFLGIFPGETCGNPNAVSVLQNTYWKLTRLRGDAVLVAPGRQEAFLVFRSQGQRLTGHSGCHRLQGVYDRAGEFLTCVDITRLPEDCGQEREFARRFLAVLTRVRAWRIDGQHLELLGADGAVLARFEERALTVLG